MPWGDEDYEDRDHDDTSHPTYGTGWSKEEYDNASSDDDDD